MDGKLKGKPKLVAQPTVFFDILVGEGYKSEKDDKQRTAKIGNIQEGDLDAGEAVNVLQTLAGDEYIDKRHIRVMRKLGEGGFAVVEKAHLSVPGKDPEIIAVKTLKPGLIRDEEDLAELIQEANVLRKLKHRYIVDFKGIGCLKTSSVSLMRSSVFFGEEYMRGGSLKGMVVRQMKSKGIQVYRAEDAWRWCYQVAEALNYLHLCKPTVVHRDLKPENVLLTSEDPTVSEARIADFGLHKRLNRVKMARAHSMRTINQAETGVLSDTGNVALEAINSPVQAAAGSVVTPNPDLINGKSVPHDYVKRTVTWMDKNEPGFKESEAITSTQDHQEASMDNVAQLGVSIGESSLPSGGAACPPRAGHFLVSHGSLQSVPEDGPILLEDVYSSSSSMISTAMTSGSASLELQPVILSAPIIVTATIPPGEPLKPTSSGENESRTPVGSTWTDQPCVGAVRQTLLEQIASLWESELQAMRGEVSEIDISASQSESFSSSLEHKVHGGSLRELLQQDAACLSPSDAHPESSSHELIGHHSSCQGLQGDLVANQDSGIGDLGAGGGEGSGSRGEGSPPGAGQELVNNDAKGSDGLKDVAPSDADAGISVPDENCPLGAGSGGSEATSKTGGGRSKKDAFLRVVDSIVVARNQRSQQKKQVKLNALEDQQRGSRAFAKLDEAQSAGDSVDDPPDAYSSVMYSLGLSGSGHMSGMVGSLMYMAPEVVRGDSYNEKIDVFSFGLIMFELFFGRLLIAQVLAGVYSPKQMERDLQRHALRVAAGYRSPFPKEWPQSLCELIARCWNQDPAKRPAMSEVLNHLQEFKDNGSIARMEKLFREQVTNRGGQWRCCTIV